jgi:hypothetical protein
MPSHTSQQELLRRLRQVDRRDQFYILKVEDLKSAVVLRDKRKITLFDHNNTIEARLADSISSEPSSPG